MSAGGAPPFIPILYEDNHILVVEKPVNIPSQEDESGDPDLLTLLKEDLKQRYNKPGNVYLGLVHRLDRPVGGVMVLAKTSKAASRLSDAIRTRTLKKTYAAVVHGLPERNHGRLIHHLLKDSKTNTVRTVSESHNGAKEAILDYEVLGHSQNLSLVKIQLHTGRPHQIRVQFASIGCPLYGDQKYGSHKNKAGQQIALWSIMLSFEHPTKKEQMTFHSRPPGSIPWNMWNDLEVNCKR